MSSPADPGPGSRDESRDDLLSYLSAHTLDADYALVAARRTEPRRSSGARGSGLARAALLAVFGVLVVTLFSQTSQDADSENNERGQLVSQVSGQRERVDAQQAEVARVGAENDAVRQRLIAQSSGGALGRAAREGTLVGTVAARGPGVLVEVDDAPNATSARNRVLDTDLQKLVNGLWAAGAEAIAVNGQRLTTLSSIRQAGDAINVNFVGLTAPYRVKVIGNPDTLPSRFAETASGATWFDLQKRVGLQFTMRTRSSLSLPAADRVSLAYARSAKTASPSSSTQEDDS
ncbi:membrane protein [Marmoricola endophyticus]|uniref:Membrane protein n=1 Tax=Marmoricola endophyticus TaxID=2040280 RepID=A0A917BEK3_9ACTN|nr:DUF881 domain-containing protein [Marmoricola endophyticus]GGF34877.1 membrane protein [Marmoricola endophyticus]